MFRKLLTTASVIALCSLTACASQNSNMVDAAEYSEQSLVVIHQTAQPTMMSTIEPTIEPTIAAVMQTAEITASAANTPNATKAVPTKTPKSTNTPKPEYTVKKIDTVSGYVSASSVNLRKGPGTDYKIIGEYERWEKLKITGICDDWYRVKIDSETGFMLIEFVEKGSVPKPTPKKTAKPTKAPTPTPKATPKTTKKPSSSSGKYSDDEIYLAAQVVYLEGKGSSTEGYKAIAGVILNRVKSSSFPNTVEGVIFQKNQFTVARNESNLRSQKPSSKIVDAVKAVFNGGENPLPSDVMFFRTASKGTSWGSREYYKTIDNNAFFS